MQPLSGNQRPDLLASLMNMSFVLRLPREIHLCRSSSNVPRLPSVLEMLQNPHVLLTFEKVHNPLRLPRETTLESPKVARTCGAFHSLTSKCASRDNGEHFFDIATSKSGPKPSMVYTFDFEMCFAPQRRALFRHLNFQKWSEAGVFCTFWRPLFRHLNFQKGSEREVFLAFSLQQRRALFHLSSGQMAPHPPLSLLFDPPEPQIIPRLSYLFAHLDLLSSDSFSSLIFSLLLFSSLWLFPFLLSSVHIVGSLTSKLPSTIFLHHKLVCMWENRASGCERFEKMSFSPKRNYWSIPQNRLKFPREFEVHLWWCPVIYREFSLENARSRDVSLLSHRHALLQRATSDLQKVSWFGVHPTPLPHPDVSNQFWVHMAVDSGRKTTWYMAFFWNIALWLYEKQITTWSLVSTGYKVLFLFYICINICAHTTIMMPASKGKPRRDVAYACGAS